MRRDPIGSEEWAIKWLQEKNPVHGKAPTPYTDLTISALGDIGTAIETGWTWNQNGFSVNPHTPTQAQEQEAAKLSSWTAWSSRVRGGTTRTQRAANVRVQIHAYQGTATWKDGSSALDDLWDQVAAVRAISPATLAPLGECQTVSVRVGATGQLAAPTSQALS
jgi:hypothetical protein